ncbi:gp5 baseplate hub subunit and tail lysozyme [Delftia phage PhiW-14]|uniref:Gp5 baseplate hub subunit and tail lysozyme n=1 Tax=Delftia phage PhiW-14 TaxID=665032 RepID=C9DG53_BPW14|nr:endolysin [Delftia phage PhiW-14]ACV50104.1 gp5 baseplate hub subunit and tail lysozyme [Delftia phage PhiW-14]
MADYNTLPDSKSQEPNKIKNDPVDLTQAQFSQIFGGNGTAEWFSVMKKHTKEKGIDTVFRLSAFFAQISVETGKLGRLEENLNYSAGRLVQVFPKYFQSKERANEYAGQPKKIASRVYANRMNNGDEASGDGWTYRGRGCIQLTGKYNYEACTRGGVSCMGANADYLLTKEGATRSAVWFWSSKNLNATADRGDFATVSRVINGGTNGWTERNNEYARILKILANLSPLAEVQTDPGGEGNNIVDPVIPIDDRTPNKTPVNDVKVIVEPILNGKSVYPWNKCFESRSGHIVELDDTPDRERMHWYHRTGTYTEFQPNGDRVEKTVLTRFVFSDSTQEAVKGSYSASYGSWYTNTEGSQTHNAALVTFTTQGGFNVTAPVAKFSDIIDGQMLVVDHIKVRRGSKFGNVCDLKARQAEYSERAGILTGANPGPIPGSYTGPNWVNRGYGEHTINGLPAHEPTDIAEGSWGVQLVDANRGLLSHSHVGFEDQTAGDAIYRVDGDITQTNGGHRTEATEGKRHIASGEALKLGSNTVVILEAPAGVLVDVVRHKPIDELPDVELFEDGDIITVNLNRKLRHFVNNAGTWEES